MTLDCIGVEIIAFFIKPATVFIENELEVVIVELESDDLVVFDDLCVLVEALAGLGFHVGFKRFNLDYESIIDVYKIQTIYYSEKIILRVNQ